MQITHNMNSRLKISLSRHYQVRWNQWYISRNVYESNFNHTSHNSNKQLKMQCFIWGTDRGHVCAWIIVHNKGFGCLPKPDVLSFKHFVNVYLTTFRSLFHILWRAYTPGKNAVGESSQAKLGTQKVYRWTNRAHFQLEIFIEPSNDGSSLIGYKKYVIQIIKDVRVITLIVILCHRMHP